MCGWGGRGGAFEVGIGGGREKEASGNKDGVKVVFRIDNEVHTMAYKRESGLSQN